MGEVRNASLKKQFPEHAEALFEKTAKDTAERRESYKHLPKNN
jgi:pyruvate-ferredoxin/flavodoxin oxidoreductase